MAFDFRYMGHLCRAFGAIWLVLFLFFGLVTSPTQAQEDTAGSLTAEQAQSIADLLKDPSTRDALIGQLDAIASQGSGEAAATVEENPVSIGQEVARVTQTWAQEFVDDTVTFWRRLARAPFVIDDAFSVTSEQIWAALRDLALVIAGTLGILFLLKYLTSGLHRSLGVLAEVTGEFNTWVLIIAAALLHMATVLAAWAGGYVLALLAFGSLGEIALPQTLYLNAFLVVGTVHVAIRRLFAPLTPTLRPIAVPDSGAAASNRWFAGVASLLGYGQLLVVPLVNQNVSFAAGRGMSALISLVAVLILIALVIAYRRSIGIWLSGTRGDTENQTFSRTLARNWYWPALAYLLVILAIVMAQPGGVLFTLLSGSAQIVGAAILGLVLATALGRVIEHGITLPTWIKSKLPLLEYRLNRFVPRMLSIIRLLIMAGVLIFALHTIGLIDAAAWFESDAGLGLTGTMVTVFLLIAGAFLIWLALSSWVDYRLNSGIGRLPTSRERTLLSLLRNAVTIVLVVITVMFVLSELGINIAPLIASAGVLGLAIGFGAQKLVQDIITGIFIQLENAMNVGDVVTLGGTTGTIESMTIRSVSLRDLEGVFHIIPFSSVDMVSNYMRDFGNFVADIGIAYREDTDDAKAAMHDAFNLLRENEDYAPSIIDDLQWFGLQSFGDSAVVLRARIKCRPGDQWAVGRAYNEILKRLFDERGIEMPFPHQTIYFGEDKEGKAPPAPIRVLSEDPAEE